MRKHVIMFFSVFLSLWFSCGWFCNKSLGVSAEDERTLTPSECRSIWGDSLFCSYSYADVDYTGTFNYSGVLSSGSTGDLRGINIESNSIIGTTSWSDYTILVYQMHTNLGQVTSIRNMHIDFILNYDTYIRGCFGIGTWATISNVAQTQNLISSFPNNKFGNISALSANSSASANFANYYNVCSCSRLNGSQYDYRLLPFEFAGGGVFDDGIYWDSVYSDSSGDVLFLLFTPIVRGSVSSDIPAVTTTVTTDAAVLPPITVNVDVDLGPVVSGLDGIAGQVAQAKEDVQGIATDLSAIGSLLAVDEQQTQSVLYLDPIDTLPTLDYHQVIDVVDGVLDDIPAAVAGTASIWGIISAFFTSDSVWLWLVPLCIFLCLASFVLWRR